MSCPLARFSGLLCSTLLQQGWMMRDLLSRARFSALVVCFSEMNKQPQCPRSHAKAHFYNILSLPPRLKAGATYQPAEAGKYYLLEFVLFL